MLSEDVVLNKAGIIERCLNRIYEEYEDNPVNLQNITRQDAIILNLQRACEAAIGLAMHIVAENGLGIPQYSRDAFQLMEQGGLMEASLSARLKAMVGFCNIAIHDYQAMDLTILQKVVENNLGDLMEFGRLTIKLLNRSK